MKAYFLVQNGASETAFSLRDFDPGMTTDDEVLIETEAFGLNFADVMARLGYYKACPPLPAIIGYDVVGRIIGTGKNISDLKIGQRVVALTRFGGYATHVRVHRSGVCVISENADASEATALATQFVTAYYASEHLIRINQNDTVLIQAAAGGVGTALIQFAKLKNCTIFGTAGSEEKLRFIQEMGVQHPINYKNEDFFEHIKAKRGEKSIDVIFDSIGGKSVKKGLDLLAPGGKMVIYGAAQIAGTDNKKSLLRQLKTLWGFGKYSPTRFFGESQVLAGINMLKIADSKPQIIQECLQNVVQLYEKGLIKPVIAKTFHHSKLQEAHNYLQNRNAIGKIAIKW